MGLRMKIARLVVNSQNGACRECGAEIYNPSPIDTADNIYATVIDAGYRKVPGREEIEDYLTDTLRVHGRIPEVAQTLHDWLMKGRE